MMPRVIATAALVVVASTAGSGRLSAGGGSNGYTVTAYFAEGHLALRVVEREGAGPAGGQGHLCQGRSARRCACACASTTTSPLPGDVQAAFVPLSLIGERYVQLFPAWMHGQAAFALRRGHPARAARRSRWSPTKRWPR